MLFYQIGRAVPVIHVNQSENQLNINGYQDLTIAVVLRDGVEKKYFQTKLVGETIIVKPGRPHSLLMVLC